MFILLLIVLLTVIIFAAFNAGWRVKEVGFIYLSQYGGMITTITVFLCAATISINNENLRITKGAPLSYNHLSSEVIYSLVGEPIQRAEGWHFMAYNQNDPTKILLYATDIKPPDSFQKVIIDGKLVFNNADDITNRIMHAIPLVEEASE